MRAKRFEVSIKRVEVWVKGFRNYLQKHYIKFFFFVFPTFWIFFFFWQFFGFCNTGKTSHKNGVTWKSECEFVDIVLKNHLSFHQDQVVVLKEWEVEYQMHFYSKSHDCFCRLEKFHNLGFLVDLCDCLKMQLVELQLLQIAILKSINK